MNISFYTRENSYYANEKYINLAPASAPQKSIGNYGQNPAGTAIGEENDPEIRMQKRTGKIECETCKNRKYQDGSNDPGVSFKTPGHIDPSISASVVMSHEQEHVRSETARASSENKKVISQSVRLETSVCPECGRSYVSGGQTTTVTKSQGESPQKDYFFENAQKTLSKYYGKTIDVRV